MRFRGLFPLAKREPQLRMTLHTPILHFSLCLFRFTRKADHIPSVITSPSLVTLPEVGSSSRSRQRSSADFPVPDDPIIEMTSPLFISTHTPFSGATFGHSFLRCYNLYHTDFAAPPFLCLLSIAFRIIFSTNEITHAIMK